VSIGGLFSTFYIDKTKILNNSFFIMSNYSNFLGTGTRRKSW